MNTLLITGGAGFIGSHFIRHLKQMHGQDLTVINVDKLTYAGNTNNLSGIDVSGNYHFFQIDICDTGALIDRVFSQFSIDAVVHFAAETHVDNSLTKARDFMTTNVIGTQSLLECVRQYPVQKFVHVSTDEVYGQLGKTGLFSETSPLKPSSPYSASKAGSDLVALAYAHTYAIPVVVTRCSNNYGPYQFPEKLIPLMILKAYQNQPLPVYGDGQNIRDWIHVMDHCRGVEAVLNHGKPGEVYNLGGSTEKTNLQIVSLILSQLGRSKTLISFVPDRLGHDYRYAIDWSKSQSELGWQPRILFEQGLQETIQWYIDHPNWWQKESL